MNGIFSKEFLKIFLSKNSNLLNKMHLNALVVVSYKLINNRLKNNWMQNFT